MENRLKDYREIYWSLIQQTKGQEYYLDNLQRCYVLTDIWLQIIVVITTIYGIFSLFDVNISGSYRTFLVVLTIFVQLVTLVYPYLLDFNKRVIKISEIKVELSILFNEMVMDFIEIDSHDIEFSREHLAPYIKKHTEISLKSDEKHFLTKVDNKFQAKAVESAIKYLAAYIITSTKAEEGEHNEGK